MDVHGISIVEGVCVSQQHSHIWRATSSSCAEHGSGAMLAQVDVHEVRENGGGGTTAFTGIQPKISQLFSSVNHKDS